MSKVPGTATVMFDGDGAVFATPYAAAWVETLKMLVPHTHRHWDPEGRAWTVCEPYVQQALEMTQWFFESVVEVGSLDRHRDWAEAMFDALPPEVHMDVLMALVGVLDVDSEAYAVLMRAEERRRSAS